MASLSFFVLFSFFVSLVTAAPWIVTEYYEEIVTVQSAYTDYYYEYTEPAVTVTEIQTIATPTGLALSTATITNTVDTYYGDDGDAYTIVQVLYPYQSAAAAAIPTTTDAYGDGYGGYQHTSYVVALAYTAPASCSSSWTYTTAVPVHPPIAVQATSVSTSFYTDNSEPFRPSTVTEVFAYVDPTQVPASSLSSLSVNYAPYPSCSDPNPTASASSSSSSGSSGSSSPYSGSSYCDRYDCNETSWINDSSYYGISPLAIILITVLGWTFVIFVAGLFENYFHFQRLMKGWQARRGLPVTWWFWAFPVSWLVCLGFSRKGYQARTVEDAQVLREKWEEIGFWKRKGLWLRHGFGTGYPSMLLVGEKGLAPPRVGRPSTKSPIATQPLLQVSPPESAAVSATPSEVRVGERSGGVEQQHEMSGVLPLPPSSTLQIPSITVEPAHSPESAEHAGSTENAENAETRPETHPETHPETQSEAQPEIHPRPSSEILPETRRDTQS